MVISGMSQAEVAASYQPGSCGMRANCIVLGQPTFTGVREGACEAGGQAGGEGEPESGGEGEPESGGEGGICPQQTREHGTGSV